MVAESVHYPTCRGVEIYRNGKSSTGKKDMSAEILNVQNAPLLLQYTHNGSLPEVKQQITEMAMNGSGIRDAARMLWISPTTVIKELKKT